MLALGRKKMLPEAFAKIESNSVDGSMYGSVGYYSDNVAHPLLAGNYPTEPYLLPSTEFDSIVAPAIVVRNRDGSTETANEARQKAVEEDGSGGFVKNGVDNGV